LKSGSGRASVCGPAYRGIIPCLRRGCKEKGKAAVQLRSGRGINTGQITRKKPDSRLRLQNGWQPALSLTLQPQGSAWLPTGRADR